MKERIYEFNCSKCKNTLVVKLSDFLQHIKDNRKDISISFTRKCLKCNSNLRFSMKTSLFVSVIEKPNAAELENDLKSETIPKTHKSELKNGK